MCRLWTGVRFLEYIIKNQNLFKSFYVALRTKKWGRCYGYNIKDYK